MTDKIDQATQNMIKNLEEMTGKTMAEWIGIVEASGEEKVRARINFLKAEHGLTYGYANLVALLAKDRAEQSAGMVPEDPVGALYAGDKADLRPIYDKLLAGVMAFGPDVVESPKRTYVSLRRNKQFALVQPSTKTRVDVGLVLPDPEQGRRLEPAGSWNSMCTHRVRLESADEVDQELMGWLKEAYHAA
jgi:predicted transport protein